MIFSLFYVPCLYRNVKITFSYKNIDTDCIHLQHGATPCNMAQQKSGEIRKSDEWKKRNNQSL